ncbi:single-stranded-DNA-specific exonuclease RecJ [Patescibacteria group bacterium]|nr:single-stranded-DNA-specific exonuclease RecJ [Patescibacteria group bacterium]
MFSLHDPLDEALRTELHRYDDLTAALLARRGVMTSKEAEAFLAPSYDQHLGDPLLIKDMKKAAERIAKAIEAKERIAVWSDYDCDGIPGGVVLHDFFKKIDANFCNYIPHRHEEGFGLNEKGIDTLKVDNVSLIITVDCGISDVAAVAYANSLGIEVLITDHHLPGVTLPAAFAIVDPKQEGETYPYKDFCGGGLAWKLVCAMLAIGFTGRENIKPGWEKWLLDMAGLSTIADMVPLTGENRVIAYYGLMVMRKSPRIGFQKLCKGARVNQRVLTEDDVGFMIAPRVNAASRMGDAIDAFRLFTTEDEVEADMLAKKLEATNRSRRASSGAVTKQVHERLAERLAQGVLPDVIVMGDPEWRPGLLGLVANGISEEHQRPVFLWGREGSNILKGSCRAGRPDVHLLELMQAATDTFVEFGGHRASGGFSVREDAIYFLEDTLNKAYASLSFVALSETERADSEIILPEATKQFLSRLERLAPFGMGNPKPVFVLRDIAIRQLFWFGKSNEHLRLRLAADELSVDTDALEAISFYAKRELGAVCERIAVGAHATILATLERDQFSRGQPVRLRIVSIA